MTQGLQQQALADRVLQDRNAAAQQSQLNQAKIAAIGRQAQQQPQPAGATYQPPRASNTASKQKSFISQSLLSGLPLTPQESQLYQNAADDPTIDPNMFQQMVLNTVREHKVAQNASDLQSMSNQNRQGKFNYLKGVSTLSPDGGGLTDPEKEIARSLLNDPNVTTMQVDQWYRQNQTQKAAAAKTLHEVSAQQQRQQQGERDKNTMAQLSGVARQEQNVYDYLTKNRPVGDAQASGPAKILALGDPEAIRRASIGALQHGLITQDDANALHQYVTVVNRRKALESLVGGAAPSDTGKPQTSAQQTATLKSGSGTSDNFLSFVQTATNPKTGHKIGKRADGTWVDAQTGAPVQ